MVEQKTNVLIVDDDPSFGSLLEEMLREKGLHSVAARDGEEALRQVAARNFHVAVLDLVMPGVGGLELGDRIRGISPDTQIMILTGYGDMESAIGGLQRGVFDYLEKASLDMTRFARSVEAAAERSRLLRHNRELMERLQASNRLLQALQEVTADLAGEPHEDRVLGLLVRGAKTLCRAATGRAVLFARTHGGGLVVTASMGDDAGALKGVRLKPGEGLAALAAESDQPTGVLVPAEHPRFQAPCDRMPTLLPGFLAVPLRRGSILGAVIVAGRPEGPFTSEDGQLLTVLARHAVVSLENATAHESSINFFTHVSEILVSFLETMDVFYPGHSRGVAALSDMVSRRLGLGDAERRSIHFGGLLHDIGKVLVDPAVLSSEGPASEEALNAIREYPALGVRFLQPITLWEEILPVIQAHHERWDGKGYPTGLAGEEIPLGARVVAVADAFDAMTRARPHGSRKTPQAALAELEAFAGSQFDPRIVRLFIAEYRERGHQIPTT